MARGSNIERITRLQNALRRAKAEDVLSNTELMHLYGVSSKGGFTNIRNQIDAFPEAQEGPRNSLLFPAKAAIEALLKHETREDEEEQERQARAAAILGVGQKGGRRKKDAIVLPPSELLKLSRLRGEIEEREREQGKYIAASEVAATSARVYAILTDNLSNLEQRVDPNGLLPAETRALIGEMGRAAQLAIHAELSDMLGDDVDDGPSRPSEPRKKARRPKRA